MSLGDLQYAPYWLGQELLLELYEKVVKTNPDKDARARAEFNSGLILYNQGPEPAKRAVDLFRRLAKEHASTEVGKAAAGFVFELENLQIGMVAPEIIGEDVDGKEIKLSQFRGQVVVLDFWGFW